MPFTDVLAAVAACVRPVRMPWANLAPACCPALCIDERPPCMDDTALSTAVFAASPMGSMPVVRPVTTAVPRDSPADCASAALSFMAVRALVIVDWTAVSAADAPLSIPDAADATRS